MWEGATPPYLRRCGIQSHALIRCERLQGREADVVIFSCVRAPKQGSSSAAQGSSKAGIGFLGDVRRMNVALTRARKSLWVMGHLHTLCRSKPWRKLAEHAAECKVLLQAVATPRSGAGRHSFTSMVVSDNPEPAHLPPKK